MRQMVVMSGFAQASLSGVDETFRNKFSQFLLSDEFGSKSGADLERLANEWRTSELANPYGANERAFLNSPEFMKLVQAQDQLDHLCTRFDNAFHSDAPTFNIDQMFADFKQNNGILVDRELSAIKSGFEFTTEGGDKTDVNGLQKLLDERTNGIKKVIQDNPSLRANNNASITAYLESIGEDFRGRQSDIGALGPAAGGPAAGGPAAGGPAAGGPAAGGPAAGGAGAGGPAAGGAAAGGPAAGGAAAGGSSTGTGTGTGGSAAGTPPAPPVPTFTGLLAEQERDAYNRMQQLGNLVTEVGVTFLNGDGNAGNGLAAAEIVAQSNMLQTSLITMAGELRADGKADQAARIDAFAARFAKDAVNAEVGRQAIEVMNDSVKALQAQAKAFQDQIKALNTQSGTLQQTIATAETKEAEKSAEAEQKLRALETTLGIAETDIARKTVQERIDAAQALINAETDEDKKTALTGELAAIEGTNTAAEAAAQAKVTATAQIETLKTKASELVEKIGDNLESIAQHRDDAAAQLDVLRVASWEIQEQLRQDDEGKKLFRGGDRPGSFADGVASFAGDNNLISGLFGSDGDDPSIISGVYDSVRAGMGDINQWWQSVKRGATSKEEAMLYNALETGTLVIGGMAAWNVVKNLSSAIGVEIPKGVSWAVVGLIAIYALKHSGVIGGEMADNITKNLNGELVTAYGQGKGAHNPPRPIASVDAARRLAGIQPPPAAGTPAAAGTTPAAGAGTPVAGSLSLTEIRTALEPTYTSMIQKFTTSGVSEQNMAYGALIAGSIEKAMADTGIQDADIPRVKAFMEKLGQDIIANGQKPEQLNVAKAFIEQIQAGKVAMPTVKQIREADGLFISIDDRKIRTFKLNAAGAPEIGDVIELSSQGQQYVENKLNAAAGVVQGSGSRIPASFYTQSPEPLQSVVAAANGDPAEIFQLRMDLQRDGTPRITAAAAN
ncbi:MAG: hypothetical protein GC137_06925 [Alphaproteobacteria bacterium]|nr:hypothetical protein [Alphaproteobacteria bacterium]